MDLCTILQLQVSITTMVVEKIEPTWRKVGGVLVGYNSEKIGINFQHRSGQSCLHGDLREDWQKIPSKRTPIFSW